MSAKIETGTEVFSPLNKLKKSPRNARKSPHSEAAIEAYAASIAAKGILQNLVVEPELDAEGAATGFYLVTIGEPLRHDGPEHVLCFAPTRSGMGVGLVIPSLVTWPGSSIVHDIKGENWQLTSGFRAKHGRVLLFDPTNPRSSAYNPLLEMRRGEWEVRDVQNIADILVDPEGSLEKRNHWEKTSHALLVGAILHVLYAEEEKTLAGVAAFLIRSGRSNPRSPP